MKTKKRFEWNKVTPLSKMLTAILFIMLPFTAFLLGAKYPNFMNKLSSYTHPTVAPNAPVGQTTPTKSPMTEKATPLPTTSTVNGLYKSNFIDFSFEYPPSWGMATNEPKEEDYYGNKFEDINFENNQNIFLIAGLYGRGGITNGIRLRTLETIRVTTKNGKMGEIIIYQDPDDGYWIEALIPEKNILQKLDYDEVLYIKRGGPMSTSAEMEEYKMIFKEFLSSVTINVNN